MDCAVVGTDVFDLLPRLMEEIKAAPLSRDLEARMTSEEYERQVRSPALTNLAKFRLHNLETTPLQKYTSLVRIAATIRQALRLIRDLFFSVAKVKRTDSSGRVYTENVFSVSTRITSKSQEDRKAAIDILKNHSVVGAHLDQLVSFWEGLPAKVRLPSPSSQGDGNPNYSSAVWDEILRLDSCIQEASRQSTELGRQHDALCRTLSTKKDPEFYSELRGTLDSTIVRRLEKYAWFIENAVGSPLEEAEYVNSNRIMQVPKCGINDSPLKSPFYMQLRLFMLKSIATIQFEQFNVLKARPAPFRAAKPQIFLGTRIDIPEAASRLPSNIRAFINSEKGFPWEIRQLVTMLK